MHPERAQAGAFLPKLLEHAGLLKEAKPTKNDEEDAEESAKTIVGQSAEKAEENRKRAIMQRYTKTDEAISELNAILVYKKVVQGLIYSPPDCDKYLALDAKPQVSVALPPTLARLWQHHYRDWHTVPKGVCGYIRGHQARPLACRRASNALPFSAVSVLCICCVA